MKWILVLILFSPSGGDDIFKLLAGESQELCERVRERTIASAKAAGVDIWGKCVEVDREPPPAKPEKPSGDGPQREDGKQRGGNA